MKWVKFMPTAIEVIHQKLCTIQTTFSDSVNPTSLLYHNLANLATVFIYNKSFNIIHITLKLTINRLPHTLLNPLMHNVPKWSDTLWGKIVCDKNGPMISDLLQPATGVYLLKVINRNGRTRCEICSKLTIKFQNDATSVVTLLLTLNIFHTLF